MKFQGIVVLYGHGSPGLRELVQMSGKSPRTHLTEMEDSVRNLRHETPLALRHFGTEKTGYRMHVLTIGLFHDVAAAGAFELDVVSRLDHLPPVIQVSFSI